MLAVLAECWRAGAVEYWISKTHHSISPSFHHSILKNKVVHRCSTATLAIATRVGTPARYTYGTRKNVVYRCYLPVLTGFARSRCIGPSLHRTFSNVLR